ncbi:MAG: type II toxin-antitoxin system RelE/ParE family toxin [Nanoarchaeota archaeon]
MLIEYSPRLIKTIGKIRDQALKERVKKMIERIIDVPEIGKPMRYQRKGTREVYIPPFRFAYSYLPSENRIIFLALYHKDKQSTYA